MYQLSQELIGELPQEFTFIYAILTIVLALLVVSFLFQLFYIPINLIRK